MTSRGEACGPSVVRGPRSKGRAPRSIDMLPSSTNDNRRNIGRSHAVLLGNCGMADPGRRVGSNTSNRFRRQLLRAEPSGLGRRAGGLEKLRVPAGEMRIPGRVPPPALPFPISVVVEVRTRPQMRRSDARGVVAVMENAGLLGTDRAVGENPRNPVGRHEAPENSEFSVALDVASADPDPALAEAVDVRQNRPIPVNLGPKPGDGAIVKFSHGRVSLPRFSWSEAVLPVARRAASFAILPRLAVVEVYK